MLFRQPGAQVAQTVVPVQCGGGKMTVTLSSNAQSAARPKLTIMLAAPELDREAVGDALAQSGFTVHFQTTATANETLEGVSEGRFDCVILGETLPDEGGEAVLSQLHGHGIETPVIFVFREFADASRTLDLLRKGAIECISEADITPQRLAGALLNAVRYSGVQHKAVEAEKRLALQALFDSLTGLANRSLFFDRVERALSLGRRDARETAILSLDLNRFRDINNVLSHQAGDELLIEVATRLRRVVRASDTLARVGADEFAILMTTGASVAGAVNMAERILEALRPHYWVGEQRVAVGISIGIAVAPGHGTDSSTVFRNADSARHETKRNNAGFTIFAGSDPAESRRQLALAGDIRDGVLQDQLVLFYQPKIGMGTGTVAGVEALSRWMHPEHGMVPPDRFIPLAEQTGAIVPLTTWLLNEALRQYNEWRDQHINIPVSVNLSPISLHDNSLPDQIAGLLDRYKVAPNALILEITESAILSDVVRATRTVSDLSDLGVQISIDDFGTGYTSFSYIRNLPIGEIKVDKSFVMNMRSENDDAVIVRAIVDMGKNLGLEVVAEGVEDAETWNILAELGCNSCQGYYISKPVDAASLTKWAQESHWGAGLFGRLTAANAAAT